MSSGSSLGGRMIGMANSSAQGGGGPGEGGGPGMGWGWGDTPILTFEKYVSTPVIFCSRDFFGDTPTPPSHPRQKIARLIVGDEFVPSAVAVFTQRCISPSEPERNSY